jgi:hypothetical protein
VISVTLIRVGIIIFASGLVVTVLAGMCGYFNFLANQERDTPKPEDKDHRDHAHSDLASPFCSGGFCGSYSFVSQIDGERRRVALCRAYT